MTTRRQFLYRAGQVSLLGLLPQPSQWLLAAAQADPNAIIDAVEILRLTGTYNSIPGVNRQYQSQPIHLYPDYRPQPYQDNDNAKASASEITQEYLRIKTKGGIEGLYGPVDPEVKAPLLRQLRPYLIGKNALQLEALWDQLFRSNRHSRAGHYMMAISAVDNTLWDIKGKYFGTPVYRLLGGPTRESVQVYGSCLGFTVEKGKAGPRAKELFDKGFQHQKWFLAYSPGHGNDGLTKNIELAEALRESLGFEAGIMYDAFMGWDLPFAKAWCKAVEHTRPYWIEEAFPPDRLESFVELSRMTTIPVASGEHFYNRWEVLHFLKAGAISVVQADPEWCGGVSELVKICHLASSFGAKVFPHGHNLHAALHVVASQSPDVCPLAEYLIVHVPHKLHFQRDPLITDNGWLRLPDKPGFGIVLEEGKIEKQEVVRSA